MQSSRQFNNFKITFRLIYDTANINVAEWYGEEQYITIQELHSSVYDCLRFGKCLDNNSFGSYPSR